MFKKGTKFQQSYLVDELIYNGFISVFHDKNPLHTNELFAREKGFKSIVMHGNILNGFISHFVGECLPTKDVIILSQQASFLRPVYINDRLKLSVEVADYFDSVKTVELKFYFQNQDSIKIARGKISIGLI
jgi:3-hydroxybutyryl-CoA dehydratase